MTYFIATSCAMFLGIAIRRMAVAIEQRNGEYAAGALVMLALSMWALFLLVSQQ